MTDDVSRENWEKWGNPDGPQAATFGIALPSWVVEKQNSLWVLALYMAIFMVALPSFVVSVCTCVRAVLLCCEDVLVCVQCCVAVL